MKKLAYIVVFLFLGQASSQIAPEKTGDIVFELHSESKDYSSHIFSFNGVERVNPGSLWDGLISLSWLQVNASQAHTHLLSYRISNILPCQLIMTGVLIDKGGESIGDPIVLRIPKRGSDLNLQEVENSLKINVPKNATMPIKNIWWGRYVGCTK